MTNQQMYIYKHFQSHECDMLLLVYRVSTNCTSSREYVKYQ